jgi:hypothetical protein
MAWIQGMRGVWSRSNYPGPRGEGWGGVVCGGWGTYVYIGWGCAYGGEFGDICLVPDDHEVVAVKVAARAHGGERDAPGRREDQDVCVGAAELRAIDGDHLRDQQSYTKRLKRFEPKLYLGPSRKCT